MQSYGAGRTKAPNGSVNFSGRFEFDLLAEKLDCLSQDRSAETEGALDDAGLASDVTRDIEGRCLSFAERVHHFEAFDGCVGRLQRLEASDRSDQLLQLPMVKFRAYPVNAQTYQGL